MEFTLTEEQEAVAQVAATIFDDLATPARVKEVERSDDRVDRHLWSALTTAGLVGIAAPEAIGGAGLGMVELALVLEQQGRRVAPVPLLWSALAAMALARSEVAGARALAERAVAGDAVLTCALGTAGAPGGPGGASGITLAGGRLSGDALAVPYAHLAERVVLAAGTTLVLADPGDAAREVAEATDHQLVTHLRFDGAPADVIGGPDAVTWVTQRAFVGIAALQLGVAEEALAQAAAYTSSRFQFGKPLSSFQSTSARAADAYIDIEAMRVTMLQAAWRLDNGLDPGTAVEVAKWWAAEAGERVVQAVQHMHGGLGADVEYPVHRYFLVGKQLADTLGGASAHLAAIGAALAAG
ncbi:MAG TPA: acyl-CoA dehydrogenase family protein [Acidimicrobiales bacterium]|nr:acyl-CoA dehydrogenase family protein [Acidimicrobiales bacterium]